MIDKPYYTVQEAAAMLNLNPETVRRAIRAGKLQAYNALPGKRKKLIITAASLQNYLLRNTEPLQPAATEWPGIPTAEELSKLIPDLDEIAAGLDWQLDETAFEPLQQQKGNE